jgi:uncharacterized membrane protein YgaE (UPF0421/DUF939 family)
MSGIVPPTTPPPTSPGLSWDPNGLLLGAAYAVPAAVVMFNDIPRGLSLAVGTIPVAVTGLASTRRDRLRSAFLGVFVGVPILLGSTLASVPWLAVVILFLLAVAAVALARRAGRLGQIVLSLGLPMVGIGFSYDDIATGAALALIMVAGSLYASLVSLLWPEFEKPMAVPASPPPPSFDYGVRLGLAGATAAAIGFALDLDHVGWACAAALLVMRPSAEMQRVRSIGRLLSVIIGALVGIAVAHAEPPAVVYSTVIVAALALLAALHGSRWYVTPAFTTLLVFLLLLYSDPASAGHHFSERVIETFVGVGLAYLFGLAGPMVVTRWRQARVCEVA